MALFKATLEEIKRKVVSLETVEDIADLLEIKYPSLKYYIHVIPEKDKYSKFNIIKKFGGEREISAPIPPLRFIQRKLNFVFQTIFQPHYCVHGFTKERNILTNALSHTKQKYVLNVDLKDFFPSINFGRVRGVFAKYPFYFNSTVATFLAQICCNNNQLPQGAPTSPIISNFICARLDRQLLNFAREQNCRYTRYADDLSFSTYLLVLPPALVKSDTSQVAQNNIKLGKELKKIIISNGFEINEKKIRLRNNKQRQVVTGLTTNRFPNVTRKFIRQVRAMLHAWQKFGLEKAEQEFYAHYDRKHRNPDGKKPSFHDVVVGKINFIGSIRGKDDVIYKKYCKKLKELNSKTKMKIELKENEKIPLLVTEGISDWKHLKAAFRNLKRNGYFPKLNLQFSEYRGSMGHDPLQICTTIKQTEIHGRKVIFIFDSDVESIIRHVTDYAGNPRYWGNRVYSFCIPTPKHRMSERGVFIELYYTDAEIKTTDSNGRRLFFNKEFNPVTGIHSSNICRCDMKHKSKLSDTRLRLIDSYDIVNGASIALSKSQFADNVLNETENFRNFNFDEFKSIFTIIEKIIEKAKDHY
ncbi:MAG: reverse transcriptase domain-containing protein [Candidatus Omnitrophica bacterium]|nr:reverse transcriptase domain-containing protein [Candidatus Omnitrophota bacterium]